MPLEFKNIAGETMYQNDLRCCRLVDISVDETGRMWINVDGICVVRIQSVAEVLLENRGKRITLRSF